MSTDLIRSPDHDNPQGYDEYERVKKLPEDNSRAVYPPKLLKMANTMGYRRDVDAGKVRKSKASVTFSKFTLTKTP